MFPLSYIMALSLAFDACVHDVLLIDSVTKKGKRLCAQNLDKKHEQNQKKHQDDQELMKIIWPKKENILTLLTAIDSILWVWDIIYEYHHMTEQKP